MGELLPYCFTRLNQGLTMAGWLLASDSKNHDVAHAGMRNNLGFYLRKNVFITSSGVFDVPVFDCARAMLGLDNLMFSVDYPFQDNFAATEFLKRCGLSPEEKERFAHGTAENLLKLDNRPSTIGTASAGVADAWYRLRTRAQSKIGRALISHAALREMLPPSASATSAGPCAVAGATVHEPVGAARWSEAFGWPGGPVPAWATRTSVPSA
jgi:Amidohydrolase